MSSTSTSVPNNFCNACQEDTLTTFPALNVFSNCPGCGVGINWHRSRAQAQDSFKSPTKHEEGNASLSFTLRAMLNYSERFRAVDSSSYDDLLSQARSFIGGEREVHLFYSKDDQSFIKTKVKITNDEHMQTCLHQYGGVVYVSLDSSPSTSPIKSKPVMSGTECPETFVDDCINELAIQISNSFQVTKDHEAFLLFAMPGSGKSTTVEAVASMLNVVHIRMRLKEYDEFHSSVVELGNVTIGDIDTENNNKRNKRNSRGSLRANLYDNCKARCALCVEAFISKIKIKLKAHKNQRVIVHIDEAQVIMSSTIITRSEIPASGELTKTIAKISLRSFVFVMLCDKLNNLMSSSIAVVISGTNALSSLQLQTGSVMKVKYIRLIGRFDPEWVMTTFINVRFAEIKDDEDLKGALKIMCMNRRACWYFLCNLNKGLIENINLSTSQIINTAAEDGYKQWCGGIVDSLGLDIGPITRATSLLQFSESYEGVLSSIYTVTLGSVLTIKFPREHLKEIMDFALAGTLNVWVKPGDTTMEVEIPCGCVLRLFTELSALSYNTFNLKQISSFHVTSQSNLYDGGHLFERVWGNELTMSDPRVYKLIISKLRITRPLNTYFCDPLVFCKKIEYESQIRDVIWAPHTVMVVKEDYHVKGRIVDVGCPTIERVNNASYHKKLIFQLVINCLKTNHEFPQV